MPTHESILRQELRIAAEIEIANKRRIAALEAELAKVKAERDALLWLLDRHGHTKLCPTRISIEFPPFQADACTCGLKTSIESARKGSK